MADMALDIVGPDGGDVAILSAGPDSSNQNAWNAAYAEALKQPDYAKHQPRRDRLRQRQGRGQHHHGSALDRQAPGPQAHHGAHHRRHRACRQVRQRRGPVRQDQGLRPRAPGRDEALHPERMRRRSSPCGASPTWATSPPTRRTCWRPVPSRESPVSRSMSGVPSAATRPSPSPPIRPARHQHASCPDGALLGVRQGQRRGCCPVATAGTPVIGSTPGRWPGVLSCPTRRTLRAGQPPRHRVAGDEQRGGPSRR